MLVIHIMIPVNAIPLRTTQNTSITRGLKPLPWWLLAPLGSPAWPCWARPNELHPGTSPWNRRLVSEHMGVHMDEHGHSDYLVNIGLSWWFEHDWHGLSIVHTGQSPQLWVYARYWEGRQVTILILQVILLIPYYPKIITLRLSTSNTTGIKLLYIYICIQIFLIRYDPLDPSAPSHPAHLVQHGLVFEPDQP